MPVTLDDQQVAQLRAAQEQWQRDRAVAESATRIWNHEVHGKDAKALWKKVFPDQQIEGFDTEVKVTNEIEKFKAEQAEEKRRAAEQAENEKYARQKAEVQAKHKFNDETMKEVEDLMVAKRIGDYEVAAEYFVSKRPQPSDSTNDYARHFWAHDRAPVFKEIAADPEEYARKELYKTLKGMENLDRGGR